MEEFRLIYYRKSDGKKFLGKMVTRTDYVILDPDTMERLRVSAWFVGKDYDADPANKKAGNKNRINFKKNLTTN